MVYFDNNATTPICKEALLAYHNTLASDWQNPSSPYRSALKVRAKIEIEREKLSDLIGVKKENIIFTSGSTETNNGIFSYFEKNSAPDAACLISPFEHSSIIDSAKYYFGGRVIYFPTDQIGRINLNKVEEILKDKKIVLVSLMAANNETGILQPWREVATLCQKQGLFFHCDATQWIGKLPTIDLSLCSSFCASAHKFSGPKGVGFLVSNVAIPLQIGGAQERSLRGGTENYPSIHSMIVAFSEVDELVGNSIQHEKWRDEFEKSLILQIPSTKILGTGMPRLWNTSMFVLPKYDNLAWVSKLDKLGFLISTGSACSTGKDEFSAISLSMGLSELESRRLIRVSSYYSTQNDDWISLANAFGKAFEELNKDALNSSVISI